MRKRIARDNYEAHAYYPGVKEILEQDMVDRHMNEMRLIVGVPILLVSLYSLRKYSVLSKAGRVASVGGLLFSISSLINIFR